MPLRKLFALAAVLALTAGCQVRFGPGMPAERGEALRGGARVEVVYDVVAGEVDPLCHIVFVPQWDVRKGEGYGWGMGSTGSAKRYEFHYSFHPFGGPDVEAKPVAIIDRKVLETGWRRFDLAAGNVFIAAVHPDGSVHVSQLPSIEEERSTADIVAYVKTALPHDARVQALDASS